MQKSIFVLNYIKAASVILDSADKLVTPCVICFKCVIFTISVLAR